MLNLIPDEYAFVAKIEVRDIKKSVEWYSNKLGFKVDPRFTENPRWRQLNMPGIKRTAIGLWESKNPATNGGEVNTIVVKDIESARKELLARDVDVSPIEDAGQGVQLAYFKDIDGNQLGLRENASHEPPPNQVGDI
ncbi:VOC family protein [Zooshikella sp. RANM57]|uniref:VOC family protein n=1 Tax=Zooshikella sp. RANM57 TaxID=3425863 RepID=UPI003D6DE469